MAGPIQSNISHALSSVGQFAGLAKLKEGQEKQVKVTNLAAEKAAASEAATRKIMEAQGKTLNDLLKATLDKKEAPELPWYPGKLTSDAKALDAKIVGAEPLTALFGNLTNNPRTGQKINMGDTNFSYDELRSAYGKEEADKYFNAVEKEGILSTTDIKKFNSDIKTYHEDIKSYEEWMKTSEGQEFLKSEEELKTAISPSDGKPTQELTKMVKNYMNKRYYKNRSSLKNKGAKR